MAASQKSNSIGALALDSRPVGVDPPPVLVGSNIEWRDMGAAVEILVEVAHRGERPTAPARLVIESAPLGAFVEWNPLTFIRVGPMMPGEHRTLSRVVARAALPELPFLPGPWRALALAGGGSRPPPPDDVDILAPAEWAGNLNVWFETAPEAAVEVHRALNLRVRGGRLAVLAVYVPRSAMGTTWTSSAWVRAGKPTCPSCKTASRSSASMSRSGGDAQSSISWSREGPTDVKCWSICASTPSRGVRRRSVVCGVERPSQPAEGIESTNPRSVPSDPATKRHPAPTVTQPPTLSAQTCSPVARLTA
jgi:hypothetical protein